MSVDPFETIDLLRQEVRATQSANATLSAALEEARAEGERLRGEPAKSTTAPGLAAAQRLSEISLLEAAALSARLLEVEDERDEARRRLGEARELLTSSMATVESTWMDWYARRDAWLAADAPKDAAPAPVTEGRFDPRTLPMDLLLFTAAEWIDDSAAMGGAPWPALTAELRRQADKASAPKDASAGPVESMLREACLNETDNAWQRFVRVEVGYMPPFPRAETRPATVVRWGGMFLRHSKGPRQGHFWDVYGDDYLSLALAYRALSEAPPPPPIIARSRANPIDQDAIRDALAGRFNPTPPDEPVCATPAPAAPPCTCGSGLHPRRCAAHPERYRQHCDEISAENAEAPAAPGGACERPPCCSLSCHRPKGHGGKCGHPGRCVDTSPAAEMAQKLRVKAAIERNAAEVATWPQWKRDGSGLDLPPAPVDTPAAPAADVATCEPWCGTDADVPVFYWKHGCPGHFCSPACCENGTALRPRSATPETR